MGFKTLYIAVSRGPMAVVVSLPVPEQVALQTYADGDGLAAGNEEEKAPKRGFQKVHPTQCMGP